jgi:acyl carrier protein
MTPSSPSSDKREDELYDVEQIQKAIQAQNAETTTQSQNYVAPSTPTQEKITQIWKELLGSEQIGVDDELFNLGGNSIMALQILGRINQLFQVEFSMDVIFTTSLTIAQLSLLVDERVIAQADKDELAAILKELDGLSDDDVKALLAKPDEQNKENSNEG